MSAHISPAVGDAIDEYLDAWGLRAVRYEVAYPTVAERPDWLLHQLQERQHRGDDQSAARSRARDDAEKRLLAALGDTQRDARPARSGTARIPGARGQRSRHGRVPIAVLRRVGLGAGRGSCETATSNGPTMSSTSLSPRSPRCCARRSSRRPIPVLRARTRREARAEADARVAPATIGPATSGALDAPDLSGFPDDIVKGTDAMLWYTDEDLRRPARARPRGRRT